MLKTILKKQKKDRENPRTNGKSKAIQTKSQKEAFAYTQKEKKEKNIYLYIKKEESKLNQYTNLLMIINSKYYTQINIKPETNYMQKANPKPTVAPKVYCLNLG